MGPPERFHIKERHLGLLRFHIKKKTFGAPEVLQLKKNPRRFENTFELYNFKKDSWDRREGFKLKKKTFGSPEKVLHF